MLNIHESIDAKLKHDHQEGGVFIKTLFTIMQQFYNDIYPTSVWLLSKLDSSICLQFPSKYHAVSPSIDSDCPSYSRILESAVTYLELSLQKTFHKDKDKDCTDINSALEKHILSMYQENLEDLLSPRFIIDAIFVVLNTFISKKWEGISDEHSSNGALFRSKMKIVRAIDSALQELEASQEMLTYNGSTRGSDTDIESAILTFVILFDEDKVDVLDRLLKAYPDE